MAASILMVVAAYMMTKAVREAVFLTKFDLSQKALVSLGLAVCAGFGTAIIGRALHGLSRLRTIFVTNTIVAVCFVAIWAGIEAHLPGMAVVLYVFVSFVGLLIIANFWLLANELYDARAAKRLFAILAAGAIGGGIVGGELTKFLAHAIGAVNLLLVVAGMVLASAFIARLAAGAGPHAAVSMSGAGRKAPEQPKLGEGFALIKSHRHLRLIAILVLLATVATTLVSDYQVSSIVKAHFGADQDAMTAWFGRMTTLFSLASLGVQLLVTSRLLRRFGVTPALLVLPLGILGGAMGIGMHLAIGIPALTAAALARVGDGGLRFSIDKSAMELLYLPVPGAIKSKAKPVIDTFVDRLGTATAAGLWLFMAEVLAPMGIGELVAGPFITAGIVLFWVGAIILMRRQYVRALREALPVSVAEKVTFTIEDGDQDQLEVLRAALRSSDARHVELALDALTTAPPALQREARVALDHGSPEVRSRAFDLVGAAGDRSCALKAHKATRDPEPQVRAAAVRYLGRTTAHGADEFVSHPDPYVRVAALAHLAAHGPRDAARASGHIAELLAGPLGEDSDLRLGVARALAALPLGEAQRHLERLLHDPDPLVAHAAGVSAARLGDPSQLDALLRALADPERAVPAREALRGHGAAIVTELATRLDDRGLPARIRRAIPDLLAAIGTQVAADALADALERHPPRTRTRVVRALWRLHRHGGVEFDTGLIEARVRHEVVAYRAHLSALERLGEGDGPGMRMLRRALSETVDRDLERIFRLLGLCYPERDVLAAYRGVMAGNPSTRAHALELLDNLLPSGGVKRALVHVLEEKIDAPEAAMSDTPIDIRARDIALAEIADASDPWLRAWAVYAAGEIGSRRLAGVIRRAADDRDERVREAAALADELFSARHGARREAVSSMPPPIAIGAAASSGAPV
jgi:AAA family ATP:ADP antiporter